MAYCSKCGKPLKEGAAFCTACGSPAPEEEPQACRGEKYDGAVHKCPNCGEPLGSFVATCPSCGFEIRETKASSAISDFANELAKTSDVGQRIVLIRSFPVPNTREDLFEFLIMASSNIDETQTSEECRAWLAKCDQCSQKGRLLLKEDDYGRFEDLAESAISVVKRRKHRMLLSSLGGIMGRTVGLLISVVLIILSVATDLSGENGSGFEMFGCFALVIAMAFAGKSGTPETVVAVICGAIALIGSRILDGHGENGSALLLFGCLGFILLIVGVIRRSSSSRQVG